MKNSFLSGKTGRVASYLNKLFITYAVGFFFIKNSCANFLTPYTAHPPTRSATTVTQPVGKREKEI